MKITFSITANKLHDAAAIEEALNKTGLSYVMSASNSGRSHSPRVAAAAKHRRTRRGPPTDDERARVHSLFAQGVTRTHISRQLHMGWRAVNKICNDVPRQPELLTNLRIRQGSLDDGNPF